MNEEDTRFVGMGSNVEPLGACVWQLVTKKRGSTVLGVRIGLHDVVQPSVPGTSTFSRLNNQLKTLTAMLSIVAA